MSTNYLLQVGGPKVASLTTSGRLPQVLQQLDATTKLGIKKLVEEEIDAIEKKDNVVNATEAVLEDAVDVTLRIHLGFNTAEHLDALLSAVGTPIGYEEHVDLLTDTEDGSLQDKNLWLYQRGCDLHIRATFDTELGIVGAESTGLAIMKMLGIDKDKLSVKTQVVTKRLVFAEGVVLDCCLLPNLTWYVILRIRADKVDDAGLEIFKSIAEAQVPLFVVRPKSTAARDPSTIESYNPDRLPEQLLTMIESTKAEQLKRLLSTKLPACDIRDLATEKTLRSQFYKDYESLHAKYPDYYVLCVSTAANESPYKAYPTLASAKRARELLPKGTSSVIGSLHTDASFFTAGLTHHDGLWKQDVLLAHAKSGKLGSAKVIVDTGCNGGVAGISKAHRDQLLQCGPSIAGCSTVANNQKVPTETFEHGIVVFNYGGQQQFDIQGVHLQYSVDNAPTLLGTGVITRTKLKTNGFDATIESF